MFFMEGTFRNDFQQRIRILFISRNLFPLTYRPDSKLEYVKTMEFFRKLLGAAGRLW